MRRCYSFLVACLLMIGLILASCDIISDDGRGDTTMYTVELISGESSDSMIYQKGTSYTIPGYPALFPAPCMPAGAVPGAAAAITFHGWNTAPDGSGTAYAVGDKLKISADIRLYAQFDLPLFSVSANKRVYFSRGNLYYDGANWGFEGNQYSFASTWNPNYVSHFFWTMASDKSYADTNSETGISGNDKLFVDTEHVMGTEWRSLSSDEYHYLFFSRANSGNKKGIATVEGVQGIILLPDTFTDPMKNNGSGAFAPLSGTGAWDNNIYSGADWNAMEAAGAIFFPASGLRFNNTTIVNVGGGTYYLLGTAFDAVYVMHMYFTGADIHDTGYEERNYGCSIRLVRDAN